MATAHQIRAYLQHWLNEVDEHSIHSPYFFDFYNNVLKAPENQPSGYAEIEKTRSNLLANSTLLTLHDLGAPSTVFKGPQRKLSDIARVSGTPAPLAQFYHRIVRHLKAKRVLELGTSLGLTTLYLALPSETRVYTLEGSESLAQVALTNFEYFGKKNIKLLEGNIHHTLPDFLQDPAKLDFVLMDANHRYEPTMQYFDWMMRRFSEKTIVVLDDIHQSAEMEKAWRELKRHELVYASVDLFRCGILFFDPDLNRQHYVWSL